MASQRGRRLVALLTVGVVAVLFFLRAVAAGGEAQRAPGGGEGTELRAPGADGERAAAADVLRRWDERRSEAYASGDVRALRRLYTPHSAAGRADVRVLQEYVDRGLVVRELSMQREEVQPRRQDRDRLVLRVRDRLSRAVATSAPEAGAGRLLPADRWSRWTVTLVHHRGRWKVSGVVPR